MKTVLESDIHRKSKESFNSQMDDNSSEIDLCEESSSETNLKKRKLVHKKSQSSKKMRRSQSECLDDNVGIPKPMERMLSTTTTSVPKRSTNVQDTYCWMCHKTENVVSCIFCPRVFHHECLVAFFAQSHFDKNNLVCPECVTVMMSECTININPNWKSISKKELNEMLSFVLLRLYNINGSSQFQTAVDNETIRDYYIIIKHPVHLNLLKSNVSKGKYHSVNSFFSDFKWILHNCTIYNGGGSLLTNYAKNLEKLCIKELNLLKSCPECFKERMPFMIKVLNEQNKCNLGKGSTMDKSWCFKYDEDSVNEMWMTKLCDMVHPLVWVRLHSYPIWPGKLISLDEESALVLFFGDYDLNIVPIGSICVHTQSNHKRLLSTIANFSSRRPINCALTTNNFTKEYQLALEELNIHLDNIKNKIEHFTIPNKKIEFQIQKGVEYYQRLRVKLSKEPHVIVANSMGDIRGREDCVSDITSYEKLEIKCDTEKLEKGESISSASVTSAFPNSALKSYRDSSSGGPAFLQCFEQGIQDLLYKFKREFMKTSGQEDGVEEWQSMKHGIDTHVQNMHQQTDRISVSNAAVQFSSQEFEKEEDLASYARYLEQCLATSEIELRRQEIMSAIRHEEYILEFTKQQKEMTKLFDNDATDAVKTLTSKVEEKFSRTSRLLKTNEWCAFCGKLARFYCCWNTCYCNQDCQTKHWEIHKGSCTQVNRQPQTTLIRPSPAIILAKPPTKAVQNIISINGDSINMNGSNNLDFIPSIFSKQRLPPSKR